MVKLMISGDVKITLGETLYELMGTDRKIYMVDADLMRIAGSGIIKENYPDRYVNTGIAEQNAVSVSAGLATAGKKVFISAFSEFLATRACDQCLDTICYNELDVKIVGTYAGISSGINGGTHISINDLANFRSMPGMRIYDVSDTYELKWALENEAELEGPAYIRIPKGPLKILFSEKTGFDEGRPIIMQEISENYSGKRVAIITSGITTAYAMEAIDIIKGHGIEAALIHLPTIKPICEDAIIQIAETHDIIVTVDNHSIIGGVGTAICEITAGAMPIKVIRLGIQDEFCEGLPEKELAKRHGISGEKIAERIEKLVKEK